jgi:hypothetical protein
MSRSEDPIVWSEHELQEAIIELAMWYGWLVYHPTPAQHGGRWRTPFRGHAGFPDLVLAHTSRGLIFAELKRDHGRVTENQELWLDVLAASVEVHIWRPADFPKIALRLRSSSAEGIWT